MPCVGIRGGDEPKHETIILTKGGLSITKVALQRHGTTCPNRIDARIAESEKLTQRRAIALLKAAVTWLCSWITRHVDRARIQARDRREDSNNLELSLIRRQEYNFTDEHLARTEALQTKVGKSALRPDASAYPRR